MPDGPHIGARIRRARKLLRMTQQELADKVGVSRTTVDAWENGRSYPKRHDVVLEEALGISLGGEPQAPPAIVPEYEWERLLLADETLPYAERVQIIEVTRRARAGGGPAPAPRPGAGGAREARKPRSA